MKSYKRKLVQVNKCGHQQTTLKGSLKKFLLLNYLIKNLLKFMNQTLDTIELEDKKFLMGKMQLPYVQYLTKKFQFLEAQLEELEDQECDPNPEKSNLQGQINDQTVTEKLARLYQQVYKYLNLLNKGLKISEKFITVLRYYQEQNQFLLNFNDVVARDFSQIYREMTLKYNEIVKIQKDLDIQSTEFMELLTEIEKCHEGMFIIFFNRINTSSMRPYAPPFIKFDQTTKTKKKDQQIPGAEFQKPKQKTVLKKVSSMDSFTSLETNSDTVYMQDTQKKKKGMNALFDLQESFKKKFSLNNDQQILGREGRKKNRSFFQVKKPLKMIL